VSAQRYIDNLAAQGRHHFTTDEALAELKTSPAGARAQLRRLKERGLIAQPVKKFFVILPPEYRRLGCLPAEQFIPKLMSLEDESYYFALLSAAEKYGAAHQRPQTAQVMIRKNRKPIMCGQVKVQFIARHDLEKIPTNQFNTPRGITKVSSPEVTALELVGYPRYAGGFNNIASIITELSEVIDEQKLIQAAELCPVSWSQRLGYLLEILELNVLAANLHPFVQTNANAFVPLRRAMKSTGPRNNDWKVIVNTEVDPDI